MHRHSFIRSFETRLQAAWHSYRWVVHFYGVTSPQAQWKRHTIAYLIENFA